MVEVIYDGGLGNNLFQYCFGRILAEKLGYRLVVPPIPGLTGTYDLVDGHAYANEAILTLRGQKPDLTFIESDSDEKYHFLLTGYFQRYEYYKPYAQRIREWLHIEDHIDARIGENDVVLSIRRGRDYIPRYGLPLSYYANALASIQYERVHICTNEPTDPFIQYLRKKYDAVIRPGSFQRGRILPDYLSGALDNLVFIKKFKKIVISNSSFAWWAAFLSDADEIIYPRPSNGMWSPTDSVSKNIDLEVDEERYHYLDCERYRSEFWSELVRNRYDEAVSGAKSQLKTWFPFLRRRKSTIDKGAFRFREDGDDHADMEGTSR